MSGNMSGNIVQQFSNFADNFRKSGKDPQAFLDELVNSGKVTQEQVNKATEMAKQFSWLIR